MSAKKKSDAPPRVAPSRAAAVARYGASARRFETASTSPATTSRTNPRNTGSRPFDEDELRGRRAGAHLPRRDMLGRVVELLRALEARELDHHDAALRRRSFERHRPPAAREKAAAEFLDDRRRHLRVLPVLLRVGHLHLHEHVGLLFRTLKRPDAACAKSCNNDCCRTDRSGHRPASEKTSHLMFNGVAPWCR